MTCMIKNEGTRSKAARQDAAAAFFRVFSYIYSSTTTVLWICAILSGLVYLYFISNKIQRTGAFYEQKYSQDKQT
jgi:hypothetical protein